MNEFTKRVLRPLMVPVVSLAVIVVVVINLSRILVGLEENNGPRWVVVFAVVFGMTMFGGFIYYASAHARAVGNSAVLATGGIVIVFAGFAGAEIIQAKENEHHAEEPVELGEPAATLVAIDNNFPVKSVTIAAGGVLGYENQGNATHTLVAEGAPGFKKLMLPGKGSKAKGLVDLEPGEYKFFCDVSGHRASGMEATVTVTEGGAAPAGGGEGAAGGGGAGGVVITSSQEIAFDKTELSAAPGSKITLKNSGALGHTFVIEGAPTFEKLVVNGDGEEATGTLDIDPGEYTFFCDIPAHRDFGMEGTLKIG